MATERHHASAVTSPIVEAKPVTLGTLGIFLLGNRDASCRLRPAARHYGWG